MKHLSMDRQEHLLGVFLIGLLAFNGCGSDEAPSPVGEAASLQEARQDGMTAAEVMERMVEVYQQTSVYVDEAEYAAHFVDASDGVQRQGLPVTVSVLLQRPNRFRIARVEPQPGDQFDAAVGGVEYAQVALASNLSVWLHMKGHNVAAIDLDAGEHGNKSLTTSVAQAEPKIPIHQPETPEELKQLLPQLAEQFHFTVADAPGGFQSTAKTNIELLKHSDFALIPVKPEFDAIEPLTVVEEIIEEARQENPLLEARVIINCLDGRTRAGRDPSTVIDVIRTVAPSLRIMKQTVRIDWPAFYTARVNGAVVVQGNRSPAKEDLDALFAELVSDMIVSINQHSGQPTEVANE